MTVVAVTTNSEKGEGSVNIKAGSRTAALPFAASFGFKQTTETVFTHDKPETFDVSGEHEDWTIEGGPKPVSMQNGDVKQVILDLKPRPWIGFQFIDDKTKKNVAGIKLGLKLPRKGEIDETSIDGELKIKALDDGKGEVVKTDSADVVWIVEKVE